MDFSITTLFVVPVGNTLPTTGSIENLTAGQVGIFKDKMYTVATAGNVATSSFIQICQGRPGTGLGTKRSDKIKSTKVKRFEKITGHPTNQNEIWEISALTANVGEDLVFSFRTHSPLIEARYANGITQSITVPGECLNCGDDPCEVVPNETVVDKFFEQLNLQLAGQDPSANATRLDSFLTFTKVGTGAAAKIRIESKPVESIPSNPADIRSQGVYTHERVWFRPFVYKQPETSVDFSNPDSCNNAGTTTLIQRSTLVSGTDEEVRQMERDYYSYQATLKSLYANAGYNGQFTSNVADGTTYDLYFIQFDELVGDTDSFAPRYNLDETAILAIPQGQTAGIEAILTAYIGAPVDITGNPNVAPVDNIP